MRSSASAENGRMGSSFCDGTVRASACFYNTNRRCALQIIPHRATRDSNTTAISRELVPLVASRSICRKCLMVSLLFAGIKAPSFIAKCWQGEPLILFERQPCDCL